MDGQGLPASFRRRRPPHGAVSRQELVLDNGGETLREAAAIMNRLADSAFP
jgi:hypothetical protein